MRRRILFLFLGLTLAGASLAWGQPGREFGGGGGFQDKFLEVKRTQLGPALGVNQQTVDQLLAIDARYKPLRHQLVTGMRSDMQRLQQLMSQPSPPEQEIKSPMIGTFYRAPSPDSSPYVEVGTEVTPETVVCIIEAMKVMNEIQAEVKGKIKKILVDNATPVQFGQALFLVDPA